MARRMTRSRLDETEDEMETEVARASVTPPTGRTTRQSPPRGGDAEVADDASDNARADPKDDARTAPCSAVGEAGPAVDSHAAGATLDALHTISPSPVRKRRSSVSEADGRGETQTLKQRRLEARLTLAHSNEARQTVMFGKYTVVAWYPSAYPEPFRKSDNLYLCPFTLKFFIDAFALERHAARSRWRHPPGREVYRKDGLSFFELAGSRETEYCQNLCLLSKLFLKHKVAFFHVHNFLFYVMVKWHSDGGHVVGYFSKEVDSPTDYNLSCILTLPQYQRQGYGRLLIEFSYMLTRAESKTGTPERPLSDLGLLSYRAYWKTVIFTKLLELEGGGELSIRDLSTRTGLKQYDIVTTLQSLGMVKYWRGKHLIMTNSDYNHWLGDRGGKFDKRSSAPVLDPAALDKTLLLGISLKPPPEYSGRGHVKKSPAART